VKNLSWLALAFAAGVGAGVLGHEYLPALDGANAATPPVSAAPPPASDALPASEGRVAVSALGRLQPKDGVIEVAGPSDLSVVIARLLVDKGDPVEQGQLIAELDTAAVREAQVQRLRAELAHAKRELKRHLSLKDRAVISDSERDARELAVKVAAAELNGARAELERAHVYSPIDGRVLEVHTREGERVGPDGIVALGRTGEMYAVAEVYESDVGGVKLGQHAVVTSPALHEPLTGTVDWIKLQVGKLDALGTDPAARKDARVVEVEIRLDEGERAAGLTNLQVEIEILL
jgi:HlyD family secretion protein